MLSRIYTRAIDEEGSVLAMRNLALMLKDGAEGVPADPNVLLNFFCVLLRKVDALTQCGIWQVYFKTEQRVYQKTLQKPSVCSNAPSRRVETIFPDAT